MSNSNGPVRRRRIAGESTTAASPAAAKPSRVLPKPAKKVVKSPPEDRVAAKPAARKQADKRPAAKVTPRPAKKTAKATGADVETARPPVVTPGRAAGGEPSQPKERVQAALAGRWIIPLVAVALAAVVFGAVFGVLGFQDFRQERGIPAANDKAAAAASSAAQTIFSFQYNNLPAHDAEAKKLMTKSFQKEFDKISPALTQLAPQNKIVVKAESRESAAMACGDECSPDKASILVFLDQARLVGTSKTPTVFGNRIVLDMVKSGNTWLVNNIRAL